MAASAVEIMDKKSNLLIHKFPAFPDMLISRLNEQRLKSSFCDAKVITKEGAVFYAHKAVLAACSPYLEAELTSPENSKNNVETVITLGMVSSISFQALLDLVYTAKLRLSPETVGEVLLAADILDLDEVGEICRQYLRSQIKSVSKQRHDTTSESSTEQPDSGISNGDEKADKENICKPQRWSSDDVLYAHSEKQNKSLKRRILNWLELSQPRKIESMRPASAPSSIKSHDDLTDHSDEELCVKRRKKHHSVDDSVTYKCKEQGDEHEGLLNRSRISESTDDSGDLDIFETNPETLLKSSHDRDSEVGEIDIITHDEEIEEPQIPQQSNNNNTWERTDTNTSGQETLDQNANKSAVSSKYFQMFHDISKNTSQPSSSVNPTPNSPFHTNNSLIKSIYMMQQSHAANRLPMMSKNEFASSYCQMLQQSSPNLTQQAMVGASCYRCNICRLDLGTEWAHSMHQRLYHQYHRDYLATHRDVQIVPQRSHSFSARTEISPVPVPRLLFKEKVLPSPPMSHPIIEFAKGAVDNSESDKNTSHVCYHCNKQFTSVMELRKHKASEHIKRPFKCDKCGAAFPNKAGLSVHLRSHTGERPYKCKVCNKAFTQLGHVQRHQKVHTGEKPYQCPLCHARVRDKASMHYHILAHKGVKPFKCDQCDARFTKRSSLVKHKNVHTGDFLYQCSQCKASFREKASLSRHVRSQHKEHVYMPNMEQNNQNIAAVNN